MVGAKVAQVGESIPYARLEDRYRLWVVPAVDLGELFVEGQAVFSLLTLKIALSSSTSLVAFGGIRKDVALEVDRVLLLLHSG